MSTLLQSMKMNPTQQQQILWLGGLLSLSILFLALIEPPSSEEAKQWYPLTDVNSQDVTAIRMIHQEETWVLEKINQQWMITDPFQGLADQKKIDRLVQDIVQEQCGPEVGTDPSLYGLSTPRWSFSLQEEQIQIDIGNDAPVGWNSYVLCHPDQKIRLSKEKWNSRLEASLLSYRDTQILQFSVAVIDKITLSDGSEFQRDNTGWNQVYPEISTASDVLIQEWLEQILDLKGTGFPDDLASPKADRSAAISLHQGEFVQQFYLEDNNVWSPRHNAWLSVSSPEAVRRAAVDFAEATEESVTIPQ